MTAPARLVPHTAANLEAALTLASSGLPVFPAAVEPKPDEPGAWTKRPLVAGWQQVATWDAETIRRWWSLYPQALPAIALGSAALFVVDADRHGGPDGVAALADLGRRNGGLPGGPVIRTAGGGEHRFYYQPTPALGNSPGALPAGIDVRGTGGFVIAPGAVRSDGRGYESLAGTPPLHEAFETAILPTIPDWLVEIIRRPKRRAALADSPAVVHGASAALPAPAAAARHGAREAACATAALIDEARTVAGTMVGGRNDQLNTSAFSVGQLVGAGWISEGEVVATLTEAALACGLDPIETANSIRSGLEAGKKKPRDPLQPRSFGEPDERGANLAAQVMAAHGSTTAVDTAGGGAGRPGADSVPAIAARPFVWQEPATIEPRRWLYDFHYVRKFVGATIAPGGVGKSALVALEALALVTGRDLLGRSPVERCRVWLWQGEDPIDEMQRRVTAAMLHFGIKPSEVEGRLFLNSGRDDPICIATQERDGVKVAAPVVDAMKATIRANAIDVVIIDPFVASHLVLENDNGAIDRVTKTWAKIAGDTDTAIELVHHSRKTGGAETTVEDGRGASALLATVRSARVLNVMSEDEAARAGIENRFAHVRLDFGKANLAPRSSEARWLRMVSVPLGNGPLGTDGDSVGVFDPWKWPNPFDGVTTADLEKVLVAVRRGEWRKDVQAKAWVGHAVGGALGIDADDPRQKERIKGLLRTWIKNGQLVVVPDLDEKRRLRDFVRTHDEGGAGCSTFEGGAEQG